MSIIAFEVPGKPEGKGRPRAARMGNGKSVRMYTPEKTVTYESKILACYLAECHRQGRAGLRFAPPVRVDIEAYFDIPKSYSKAKAARCRANENRPTAKPDADNIAKAVCDALTGAAYADDTAVTDLHIEKRYGDRTRLVVRVMGEPENGGD